MFLRKKEVNKCVGDAVHTVFSFVSYSALFTIRGCRRSALVDCAREAGRPRVAGWGGGEGAIAFPRGPVPCWAPLVWKAVARPDRIQAGPDHNQLTITMALALAGTTCGEEEPRGGGDQKVVVLFELGWILGPTNLCSRRIQASRRTSKARRPGLELPTGE